MHCRWKKQYSHTVVQKTLVASCANVLQAFMLLSVKNIVSLHMVDVYALGWKLGIRGQLTWLSINSGQICLNISLDIASHV